MVWSLLASARTWSEWGDWQSTSLEREGDPPPDGVGAIRVFVRRPITTREEVVLFEPQSRLGYKLLSGLPMENYGGEVTLTDSGGGGTNIHWESRFDPKYRGTGRLLRAFMQYVIGDIAKQLVAGAEAREEKPPRRFKRTAG